MTTGRRLPDLTKTGRRWLIDLTWLGRLSIAGGLIAVIVGFSIGQLILIRVAVLLAALPLLCLWLVRRARPEVAASRRIEPGRLHVGEEASVTVIVANNGVDGCGCLLALDSLPVGLSGTTRFAVPPLAPAALSEASYQVQSLVRGRYRVGPLNLRLSDPFGMCALDRSISGTDELIVVPAVHPLPQLRLGTEATGTSDTQSKAMPTAGDDDLCVREYRRGDSLRRVNWRVTARRGELMVRQEEHPPQTRATILLDARAGAHRGEGLDSSLEWAISAVASIGVHLVQRRFSLRVFSETGPGLSGLIPEVLSPAPGADGLLLDGLATLESSPAKRLLEPGRYTRLGGDGLIIAVAGDLAVADAEELAGRRRSGSTAIALLLDVATWGNSGHRRSRAGSGDQSAVLRNRGWSVVTVRAGDDIAELWPRVAAGPSRPRPGGEPPPQGAP